MEWLSSIDRGVFALLNQTLATPIGDVVWPLITDYDKFLPMRLALAAAWLWLVIRGGKKGRTVALLLIPLIFLTDVLTNRVLKELITRPRPCREFDGIPIIQGIRLLVDCGPGKSFPSSHAVNNFAAATLFSYYYRRGLVYFVGWASLVALSRVAVGVHYPSDIVGGALLGSAVAALVIWIWQGIDRRYFSTPSPGTEKPGN